MKHTMLGGPSDGVVIDLQDNIPTVWLPIIREASFDYYYPRLVSDDIAEYKRTRFYQFGLAEGPNSQEPVITVRRQCYLYLHVGSGPNNPRLAAIIQKELDNSPWRTFQEWWYRPVSSSGNIVYSIFHVEPFQW